MSIRVVARRAEASMGRMICRMCMTIILEQVPAGLPEEEVWRKHSCCMATPPGPPRHDECSLGGNT